MCLWNEGCIPRIKEELELNILTFIRSVQEVIDCFKFKILKIIILELYNVLANIATRRRRSFAENVY
jgi:hypothetical protein